MDAASHQGDADAYRGLIPSIVRSDNFKQCIVITGGVSGVDPLRAIDLKWTLRDIKAKRTVFPVDPDHLRELIELGLVEMRDDVPVITNAGHQVLD